MPSERSRATVLMRAISLRSSRSFFTPSFCPSLAWKRMRKSCSEAFASSVFNSSSLQLRIFVSSIVFSPGPAAPCNSNYSPELLGRFGLLDRRVLDNCGPLHEARLQGQLVGCQAHRFLRDLGRNSLHLEEDLAGTDHRHPMIQRALARTHSDFGWLLGDRLVREQTQPDLAAALDEARHRDTAGFDLAVGNIAALHDLQPVFAKAQRGTAPRLAAALALLLLAKLNLLWHQHSENPR